MVGLSSSFVFLCCLICSPVLGRQGFGPGDQDWDFITVREGAHMFYWLYYTTANVKSYTDRPLAIWLQGGPGASSTGYGNFEELGPLTLDLKYRNHTWVNEMNVLFIDNPVGSGYSYVDNTKYLTKTNKQIALDLVELMKGFYKNHPEFKTVPLHIFCESYGGKMSPEFALELDLAIKRGEIQSNLSSVALGDPWVSPMDSVWSWAPFLLHTGIVDEIGYEKIMEASKLTENAIKAGKWVDSTNLWGQTQRVVMQYSKGVDFYNILKKTAGSSLSRALEMDNKGLMYRILVDRSMVDTRANSLDKLMKNEVAAALNISSKKVIWGAQSGVTFNTLAGDFMKPAIETVEALLNTTNIQVGVFSGHLDLICATPGTVNWISKMNWPQKKSYESAHRIGVGVDGVLEGYYKEVGKFSMYWINRAGHMVPNDNPAGMSFVLRKFTNYG